MKQHGFTLTELLLSLVLGSFILLMVSLLLVSSTQTWRYQQLIDRDQEALRFVVERLRSSVRQAQGVELTSNEFELFLTLQSGEGARNCLGQLQSENQIYHEHYAVEQDQLRCNGQALIQGITSLNFAYVHSESLEDLSKIESVPSCCDPIVMVLFDLDLMWSEGHRFTATLREFP
ncbi:MULTISPECIES: prepilin-type N-terminal cleavage/methylation domain-containing protein [Nitrincola]|uniref:Tfp pilus assembly protein PilW n=1 Tax=Nitrincola nitratireducens TaxID=1229521 RepID=W9V2Q5_9GAMM|nr:MULTISPECIES: prepilin-type N-terminal cleavage/methylation domain-containing protein [Nitrincola]EXJ10402.1 Tfp pilus assembly protein PilW [Nitrincola nitratireducens]